MANVYKQRAEKFLSKLPKEGFTENTCWEWQASCQPNGYGRLAIGKTRGSNFYFELGHRFSWAYFNEQEIPKGMQVLHRCDNRKCCNPLHLMLGTQMDNMKDKIAKGRDSKGLRHSIATKLRTPKGSKNASAKLKESDIPVILELAKKGVLKKDIALNFGVSKTCIQYVLNGRNWAFITGIKRG